MTEIEVPGPGSRRTPEEAKLTRGEGKPADVDARAFAALGHPIRLDMLRQLVSEGEVCCGDFRVLDRIAQPTVSHHLHVLREAGLVRSERDHSFVRYRAEPAALRHVADVLEVLSVDAATAEPERAGVGDCCSREVGR